MQCLYAQGHSVSRFPVSAKGRPAFLAFVRDGVKGGWDEAVRKQYGYKNVEDLEKAWLDSYRHPRTDRESGSLTERAGYDCVACPFDS